MRGRTFFPNNSSARIIAPTSPRAHWINGRNIPVDGLEQPYAPVGRRPF
jgi:hypothetical protein